MELEEKAEELLETIWICTEEGTEDSLAVVGLREEEKEATEQLLKVDYIMATDGHLRLTKRGRPVARNVVRRHRLAERLLTDVLGTSDMLLHEKACKFEHLLDRGLDESICSLLGHPKICPHSKPIPPGGCCQQERAPAPKLVSPLSRLSPRQKGKVAYIYATESSQLQKLMAMGILPGASISLIRGFPSYVFQIGQTQFAVDKEIAKAIYVRLVEPETISETQEELPHGRGRGCRLRRFGRWWSKRS
ncbi:MAG: DtxR family iron (metal) dependent repressor [Dehalococcoidales bacterium]|jgi:DtxR family Mn-dependent transcriptional regulator|nr:DtxR family iron (metal) dependent repressor [Dehalococcoidales bacterium]MDP6576288.1 metal-dependent transcriptional regulator [Dehalococcoidales bacterium]MDP6824623.1 metal-dependent transcriptional regulator [Dehalococcoidales bacterium]|tara:strand:- start:817 stop:1560 length:744 start_codon:yes stop_codon:yes gene_type:complete